MITAQVVVVLEMKYENGLIVTIIANWRYQKKVENEFRIECEECDSLTIILVEDDQLPKFCPMCGSQTEVEDISDGDWQDI